MLVSPNLYRGLSLCIQGTRFLVRRVRRRPRFIPVYTGNSAVFLIVYFSCTVYPCVYRELISALDNAIYATGLSLCIQGTLI